MRRRGWVERWAQEQQVSREATSFRERQNASPEKHSSSRSLRLWLCECEGEKIHIQLFVQWSTLHLPCGVMCRSCDLCLHRDLRSPLECLKRSEGTVRAPFSNTQLNTQTRLRRPQDVCLHSKSAPHHLSITFILAIISTFQRQYHKAKSGKTGYWWKVNKQQWVMSTQFHIWTHIWPKKKIKHCFSKGSGFCWVNSLSKSSVIHRDDTVSYTV